MPKNRDEFKTWLKRVGLSANRFLDEAKVSQTSLYKYLRNDPTLHEHTRARLGETFVRLEGRSRVSA